MDASDLAIVARIRAGDREAFRILVERHSRSVFRLAYRLTGHEQDAIKRQIEATDQQIDRLVYELYGLTEEEIAVVQGTR